MADPKRVDAGNSNLGSINDVLTLLDKNGGGSTSKTTSDTGALSAILENLKGTNYDNVLQSIFTQAGGQIPGLTAGLSNSIGARTGGNSAVTAALGKLLESTAMKAAGQTAQLQQNNQNLQLQAAQGIAGGNKSTTTKGSGGNTGKILAGLQLGGKFLDSNMGKSLMGAGKNALEKSKLESLFGESESAATESLGSAGADFSSLSSNPGLDSFNSDFTNNGLFSDFSSGNLFDMSSTADFSGVFDAGDAGSAFDVGGFDDIAGSFAEEASSSLIDDGGFFDLFEFADGGLVGRDGTAEIPGNATWKGGEGEPKSHKTKQPTNAEGTPQAYADGGRVEPKVGTKGPQKSGGTGGGLSENSVRDANSPKAVIIVLNQEEFDSGINPRKTLASREKKAGLDSYADGGSVRAGGGRVSSRPSFDVNRPVANTAVQSPRADLNPAFRRPMQNQFSPLEDGLFGSSGEANAMSESSINSIDPANSAAVGNAIGNAVGHAVMSAVVGPVGMMGLNALGVPTPTSALSQAVSALMSLANPTAATGGVSSPSPTGTVSVSDMSVADTATDPDTSTDPSTDPAADSADAASDGTSTSGPGTTSGDSTSGSTDGDGNFSSGGRVRGKGTGTSDSITAKLSTGEYVIPADVVQTLGVRFFDELKNHFHTPADVQNGK